MKTKILGRATLIAAAIGMWGSNASAQSIKDALAQTYSTNPSLMAARARLRGVDEQVPQALSGWRPTVEMSAEYGSSSFQTNTLQPPNRSQHRDPRSIEFSISQPLYSGGQTTAATQEAENNVKAERARLVTSEQNVLAEAATAYLDVVRDQLVLDLNINNVQVLNRQLEAIRDRFAVGEVTQTDVSQAESRLARANADRIQSQANLEISRAAYRNVVGDSPGRLVQPPQTADLPGNLSDAVKIATTQDPRVAAAEFDELASSANVDQNFGALLPSIRVVGTASRFFDSTSETSRVDEYEGKFVLSVPIYQAGEEHSVVRAAKQAVAERRRRTDQARLDATEAATLAWEKLTSARARVVAFNAEIRAAEVAYDGVRREAEVGSRTVLDVLDAEQELLNARVDHARASRDEQVASYELKVATGQMTARRLALGVEVYEPEDHYREVRDKWFGLNSSGGAE